MVLRTIEKDPFYLKIDGKWCRIDDEVLRAHPGGSAITTYKNMDATTVFHTFHGGSKEAYTWLSELKKSCPTQNPDIPELKDDPFVGLDDANMGVFDLSEERCAEINRNFERLRIQVKTAGLMDADPIFYIRKVFEAMFTILLAFLLQYHTWYVPAAILMGIAWQQLGWLIHEFAHHQMFKNRYYNDLASYFVGNFLQGFSSGGWKEQHNVHHAATNVVGKDGDLDLVPFYATVAEHLSTYPEDSFTMMMFRWQHVHWPLMLPWLRISWLIQSLSFVYNMPTHYYDYYRKTAIYEQVGLALHWSYSLLQLYLLPCWTTRIMFFFLSHLVGGFLLAHVVTYNHYSVQKYSITSNIMSSYACLQMMTTRNMRPGWFIDWLWGGLNYQIEHHLFPTMPRHNLNTVMPLVKQFAADNGLPYMVDGYFTGFCLELEQFRNIASVASKITTKTE